MKKKSYVYFIAPLVGLVIFAGIYWQYASTYDAKLEAVAKKQRAEREEKIRKENESKKAAVEAAVVAQEKRKQEKAAKEAKDQKDKDDREKAVQARAKAREDGRKFTDQVARLKKEVDLNKKDIAKIEEDKKRSIDEQKFLAEYVKKAEANAQGLSAVLEKIDAADKAAEAAAKAAAAAAAAAAKKK